MNCLLVITLLSLFQSSLGSGRLVALSYDLDKPRSNSIVFLDAKTGLETNSTVWAPAFLTTCTAYDPGNQKYYAYSYPTLYTIDVSGDKPLPSTSVVLSDTPVELAYDSVSKQLYGVFMTSSNSIGSIDVTSGKITYEIPFDVNYGLDVDGTSYDSNSHRYFLSLVGPNNGRNNSTLAVFDTKQKKLVSTLTINDTLLAQAYDSVANQLVGIAFHTNDFVKVDLNTGRTELLYYDVPGIPALFTSTIDSQNHHYYVELINGKKRIIAEIDSQSGKTIGLLPTPNVYMHVEFIQ